MIVMVLEATNIAMLVAVEMIVMLISNTVMVLISMTIDQYSDIDDSDVDITVAMMATIYYYVV